MDSLIKYFSTSFHRKLLLFSCMLVIVATVFVSLFLIYNMRSLSDFALKENEKSLKSTVRDYLDIYVVEKATSLMLRFDKILGNLKVLGKTSQNIIDNYEEINRNKDVFSIPIFQTNLQLDQGGITAGREAEFDIFIPPYLANKQSTKDIALASSLLNLSLPAIQEVDPSQSLIYFVGDQDNSMLRSYPNLYLITALENIDFWDGYFPPNVDSWTRWYSEPDLRKKWIDPITVEFPYNDPAGQGVVMTLFYPMWDYKENKFAGAVGLDLSLNQIIEDLLSIRVAQTGFAFLVNDIGEVIAMKDEGYKLLGIPQEEIKHGKLGFNSGLLSKSPYSDVRNFIDATRKSRKDGKENGVVETLLLEPGAINDSSSRRYFLAYAKILTLADNRYNARSWKLGIFVPESEILAIVKSTEQSITGNSDRAVFFSILLVLACVFIAVFVSIRFSGNLTKDLNILSVAANQISKKDYDINLDIRSRDEIGKLGLVFRNMASEIQDYTTNLEAKVSERTISLQKANDEILLLNEKLKDENLRLGAEIDIAKQLQKMVLPPDEELSEVHQLDIACYMEPADEVGGDYYEVLQLDNDQLLLGIGDVTGHGLSAGVVMLMVQTACLTLSKIVSEDIGRLLYLLNHAIYRNMMRVKDDKNMTLALLLYKEGRYYVSGQHESVIICRKNGEIEEIDTMSLGFPIGMVEDIEDMVGIAEFSLEPDDIMILYTDGVTEAENPDGVQYDSERFMQSIQRNHTLTSEKIKDNVISDLLQFIDGNTIYDDISLVVVKQR